MWLPNPGLRNSPMGPRNSFARHKLGMLPRRENLFALPIHGQSHFSDGKGVATILRHTGCDRTTHSLSMRSFSSRSRAGKDRHSGGWEKSRGASHRLGAGAGPGARCITAPVPRAWARKNTQHNTPRTPAGASLHPAAEARIDSTFRSHLGRFVPHRVPTHGIVTVTRFDGTLATPEASTLSTMYS